MATVRSVPAAADSAEVERRLRGLLQPDGRSRLSVWLTGGSGQYSGWLGAGGFELTPRPWYRDGGYRLKMKGVISSDREGGSEVLVRFRSGTLWLLIWALLGIFELVAVRARDFPLWFIPLFGVTYHALGCFLYARQLRRGERDLRAALGSIVSGDFREVK